MDDHGWDKLLWLETTLEDPGPGQAEAAVSAGADLVLACGGDGTVTACADGIVGTARAGLTSAQCQARPRRRSPAPPPREV